MQYSLNKITTVTACNALLAKAQKTKQTLERKRRNLGESIDTFRARMDRMAKETAEVQALLGPFTTCYHALPEGKYKLDLNIKVKRLELRQARLDMKAFTYNVYALLAKQVKYNMLDQKLSAIDFYIIALQNHLATLVGTLERVSQEVEGLWLPVAPQKTRVQNGFYRFERRFLAVTDGARAGLPSGFEAPVRGSSSQNLGRAVTRQFYKDYNKPYLDRH
jgi:hypothetical protein